MSDGSADIVSQIGAQLPYLRRYARAMTGSQASGDTYAAATLEAILQDRSILNASDGIKVGLFRTLHSMWESTHTIEPSDPASGIEGAARKHLSKLTPHTREALLLSTLEGFNVAEIATIMQRDTDEVSHLISVAHREMADSIAGRVLIIEDEAVIAMDLEAMVSDLGHQVVGIARTRAGAVEMGGKQKPDLILADIQLADNSSGIDAVNDLLVALGDVPVVFITAFPERLLTGERPEPAFLISKPYTEDQISSAVSQAMFFSSTETLMS
ncbi:MAG: response regulator [Pseudomonadota bacterium]